MSNQFYYFDFAATTCCSPRASQRLQEFTGAQFGNPSSSHALGQKASRVIREARQFFGEVFGVSPNQVIFTGSGTESDNLALYGITLPIVFQKKMENPRVIVSAVEHPAVAQTAQSLKDLGVDVQIAPVLPDGRLDEKALETLLTPNTVLVSIMRVNNIVGTLFPVEELAEKVKSKVPGVIFHTDAIQAFGKVPIPKSGSAVDLVSISGHKIRGPKGVGALVILNSDLLKNKRIRPLIWGGGQENGLRSGTQNAGLISAFHIAAEEALSKSESFLNHCEELRSTFKTELEKRGLLNGSQGRVHWNSPSEAVPYVVNLSIPGFPTGPLAKLLEERFCLVSTGSACSSAKADPDTVLAAMGKEPALCQAALRISFSSEVTEKEIIHLSQALQESIQLMEQLLGGSSQSAS